MLYIEIYGISSKNRAISFKTFCYICNVLKRTSNY
uniref:Uncharacterized protein n=1 Tax=Siphoviridae sp. ctnks32 TaxID=2826457 RepID=A0A8S5N2H0_9CAUD|nr:MAG TPA: hypothetical protein [Siphoviridae sp. ctnks32]